jgi:Mg-chelatase subunit ChlD
MQNANVSLAESFLTCDCIVLFDVSASMESRDGKTETRFERGIKELKSIQETMPGKFAIVQFADRVEFMPGGVPVMGMSGSGTDLTAALKYAKIADEIPDMRFIVISDGEPNNELTAIQIAGTYTNHIDTIFIGCEDQYGDGGKDFLNRLARYSGGKAVMTAAENIGETVTLLLADKSVCA